MGFLTKELISTTEDAGQIEIVAVPEWGGDVRVMEMDAARRDAFQAAGLVEVEPQKFVMSRENFSARLAVFSLVDESGHLLFSPEDIEVLGRKSGKALERIATVAIRLSKLSDTATEQAKND